MNCIDAIEKNAQRIIDYLLEQYRKEKINDADYVRSVKAVIEGTDAFVCANQELTHDPALLKRVLSAYAKDRWMTHLTKARMETATLAQNGTASNLEYFYYLYDHLYEKEQYPL